MQFYVARRLGSTFFVLLGVSALVFGMIHVIPGDPVRYMLGEFASPDAVEQLRRALGLDAPLHVQYLQFIRRVAGGDLGRSLITNVPLADEIKNRFPVTLRLGLLSIAIGAAIGLGAGVMAAVRHNRAADHLVMVGALIGISAPSFWIAFVLMWAFAVRLPWFPVSGYDGLSSLVLPAVTLGLLTGGGIARLTRSSLLEVLRQDYVRTARAKGAGQPRVLSRHALRNALIPVVTLMGLQFGGLLSGAVVTETVFALPGIGQYAVQAITRRDFPVIQGVILMFALVFVLVNLLVDLLYALIDPRIRYE
jgi:ABC-type dipeptide/oligopeptide/nickel transport system permease component